MMMKNPIKQHVCGKDYIRNPGTCANEIEIYLKSIVYDSVVTFDEITGVVAKLHDNLIKTTPINLS